MLIYSLRQACTFLATERLYRGFGTALTPLLAPSGQRCSVGVEMIQPDLNIVFGEGKVFVVACAFKT